MKLHYQQRLSQQCELRGVSLTTIQYERLLQYLDLLLHWRPYLNLTGLRDAERMLNVLIIESLDFLAGESMIPTARRVLDLGTGAGVPGIPLAICYPDIPITLLDRSAKKIAFLQRVVTALQLNNCQPHCRTAEEIAQHLPSHEAFDVVVSRGVGSIAHLMRLTRRLVTADGYLLLRKPLDTPELQDAKRLCTAGEWHHLAMVPLPWSTPPPWALISIQRCC